MYGVVYRHKGKRSAQQIKKLVVINPSFWTVRIAAKGENARIYQLVVTKVRRPTLFTFIRKTILYGKRKTNRIRHPHRGDGLPSGSRKANLRVFRNLRG